METYRELEERGKKLEALIKLSKDIQDKETRRPVPFDDFLFMISEKPALILRDIFQLFYDMVKYYIPEGKDEYQISDDSIGFVFYDCSRLFQKDCDNPFFADRLFSNRFIDLVNDFKKGFQNNRFYLFEGPPGSGKSTFLNNLLYKFEKFTHLPEGNMYNTFWRLDIEKLGGFHNIEKSSDIFENIEINNEFKKQSNDLTKQIRFLDISCPNQDHPILQIPKTYRKNFLDTLIPDIRFKEALFNNKEYEWLLKDSPCAICNSIYTSLMDETGDPKEVYSMLYARKAIYSRQFGDGISIFNPGDPVHNDPVKNPVLQGYINQLLKNDTVRFIYSYLANTNNGVYALMDIKENNIKRLKDLHGIISDGVHKVELMEERIKSLFFGLVNPEDKEHYEKVKSFQDRIITVNIPYILDYKTEVAIYLDKFGKETELLFLPRVLENFAKIIISTRMEKGSPAINKWLKNPEHYYRYTDKDLLLMKMSLYSGKIPNYFSEEDIKHFDKNIRKEIIAEAASEGKNGFSGRQSIYIFNIFLSKYHDPNQLITMEIVRNFFETELEIGDIKISNDFLKSLLEFYNYNIVQEVKEAIYYYNEKQIVRDIKNYLFTINFDPGDTIKSEYTGDIIKVDEEFFKNFEAFFLGADSTLAERRSFRHDIQTEYITNTLAQEIHVKNKNIEDTELFKRLFEKYTRNLKENALTPYYENDNFRRAIMDYKKDNFENYDSRLKRDITLLITNLQNKFNYTEEGAKQISIYVVDNDLARKFN